MSNDISKCTVVAMCLGIIFLSYSASACDPTVDPAICSAIEQVYPKKAKEGADKLDKMYPKPGSVKEYGTQQNRDQLKAITQMATPFVQGPTGLAEMAMKAMDGMQKGVMDKVMGLVGAGGGAGSGKKINEQEPYAKAEQSREGKPHKDKDPNSTSRCKTDPDGELKC